MKLLKPVLGAALLAPVPALAASGPFFSLHNTNFVVTLGFIVFLGVVIYYKVPGLLGGMLDKRAAAIRAELEEARLLREEAQKVLADYERKSREVKAQAEEIVSAAKRDAEAAAEQAKADLQVAIARRVKAAEDQIASAEAGALRAVKDRAVTVAVAAAAEVLTNQMGADRKAALIDDAIDEVSRRLH